MSVLAVRSYCRSSMRFLISLISRSTPASSSFYKLGDNRRGVPVAQSCYVLHDGQRRVFSLTALYPSAVGFAVQ